MRRQLNRWRGLAADRRGNVAVIFAVAVLPIALLAGGAVDLRRQATSDGHLQEATDAAVLAATVAYFGATGRSAADRLTAANDAADGFMQNALADHDETVLNPAWALTYAAAAGEFTLDGTGRSPAAFGGLFGVATLPLGSRSSASSGEQRLEVALVLDSTGSMAGSKIANLKTAATNFVNIMAAAADGHPKPDAVKISLAPYNNTVNVGSANRGAAWLDGDGESPIHYENFSVLTKGEGLPPSARVQKGRTLPTRFDLFDTMKTSWGGCIESRPYPFDVNGAAPSAGDPASLYVPYFAPDEPDKAQFGQSRNDYLRDTPYPDDADKDWLKRQQNIDKYVAQGSVNNGPNNGCIVAPVVRLTTNFGAVKSGIAAMQAAGNTNIFMGLAWGWNTLAPQAPFSDGVAYKTKELTKVAILMTDGDNVYSPVANPNGSDYAGLGYIIKNRLGITSGNDNKRQKAMDARLSELCENVKKEGVVLYTIRVEVKSGSSKLLRDCASSPDHFRDVQNASELDAVFKDIANAILQVRLTK